MTSQEHVYKVVGVEKVTDGDTYWLRLDVGFRQSHLTELRLLGYDTPETRSGSKFERRQGIAAYEAALEWLSRAPVDGMVRQLWVRTEKEPDSFGRWLGELWAEYADGARELLGDELVELGLATIWPVRWHEIFDPARDKP